MILEDLPSISASMIGIQAEKYPYQGIYRKAVIKEDYRLVFIFIRKEEAE
jgi:hypothetical protein